MRAGLNRPCWYCTGVCEGGEGELVAVEEGVEHFGVYARDDVVAFVVDVTARLGTRLGATGFPAPGFLAPVRR